MRRTVVVGTRQWVEEDIALADLKVGDRVRLGAEYASVTNELTGKWVGLRWDQRHFVDWYSSAQHWRHPLSRILEEEQQQLERTG